MSSLLIYEGKAKKVYSTQNSEEFILEFKDSLTAFNALKKGQFENKGGVNRDIAALIFEYLKKSGIDSHYLKKIDDLKMLVKKVEIIPFEVVIRNVLAGSTAKKLGKEEGELLPQPLVEFYYKDDALGDPFVSDDQMKIIYNITELTIKSLKEQALLVNQKLKELFLDIGITLVDFKIEFGKSADGKIILADEITPDCCRLWDIATQEKLDKDRFRRDLGQVKEKYEEVLKRLTVASVKWKN